MGSRDLLFEFWDPFISQEWLKLVTSNLACIFSTRGPNKKCKLRSKRAGKGSRDLLYEFLDPLHILRTIRARIFKFGMQTDHQGH